MLLRNVVIDAIDAALHDREIALNRVGVHVATGVLADAVIDRSVLIEKTAQALRCCTFVCVDDSRTINLSLNNRAKVLRIDGRDMVRANTAAALDKRIDRLFTNAARSFVLTLAAVLVFLQTADESFVH